MDGWDVLSSRLLRGNARNLKNYFSKGNIFSASIIACVTFFIALLVSLGSEALVRVVDSLIVAFVLLLVIIFLNVFFDTIGTAATAADLPPFNARAAKKVYGARQAVRIIRNADLFANFCNDVVGDVAGTLSGAIGAGIVLSMVGSLTPGNLILAGSVMTSFIAAITVGGKALGKMLAVNYANEIIFRVAVVIAWWENVSGMELFKTRR